MLALTPPQTSYQVVVQFIANFLEIINKDKHSKSKQLKNLSERAADQSVGSLEIVNNIYFEQESEKEQSEEILNNSEKSKNTD